MQLEFPPLIHMDTNFMIKAYDASSYHRKLLEQWVHGLVSVHVSTPAWMEFRRDSSARRRLDHDVLIFRQLFNDQIVSFDLADAERAALLFKKCGRPTSHKKRFDIMVAACAIEAGAELATDDVDFDEFIPLGLRKANTNIDL